MVNYKNNQCQRAHVCIADLFLGHGFDSSLGQALVFLEVGQSNERFRDDVINRFPRLACMHVCVSTIFPSYNKNLMEWFDMQHRLVFYSVLALRAGKIHTKLV